MTYETKEQQRERQGGSHRRGGASASQLTGEITRFLAEFLQRIREAPPGTRVYMAVGDMFKDADVHNIEELRAARRGAVVSNDKDEAEDGS
jgi:hypothetical protein